MKFVIRNILLYKMMEICRLCLSQNDTHEASNDYDIVVTFKRLQEFIPFVNRSVYKAIFVCDTCIKNVESSWNFICKIKSNETKVLGALKTCESDKLEIISLHENNGLTETKPSGTLCRLCLDVITCPIIFLCESNCNILPHTLVNFMLEYCLILLNLELTEKPSMCLKCWECLQIAYTFKKNYEETEKKIKLYNQKFKSRNQSIVEKMLPLIKQYFRDNENNTAGDSEEESADSNNYNADRIRCEHSYIKSPVEIEPILFSKNKQQKRPLQKQRRQFSEEEDQALLTSYFEITSNEQNFSTGYWRRIHNKWQRMFSKRSVKVSTLRGRLSTLLRNNSIPVQATKKVVEKPNVEYKEQYISENCVKTDSQETEPNESSISYNKMHYNSSDNFREINLNHTVSNSATENDRIKIEELSDSDDTFTEEAVKSSFTPHVKTDPLDDSDSEIDVVETRIERFSKDTWENLPQLERMDIPPMTFRIEATYSLDDKRNAFNSVKNDSYLDPNLEVEEVKTCRRFLFKNQSEEGLFKCLSCNFETKFRGRANCHSRWHKKGKNGRKLYKCNICPYKISNKRMIKIHEKLHKEENDIPVLVPMCT